jgi:hypothetical protein
MIGNVNRAYRTGRTCCENRVDAWWEDPEVLVKSVSVKVALVFERLHHLDEDAVKRIVPVEAADHVKPYKS